MSTEDDQRDRMEQRVENAEDIMRELLECVRQNDAGAATLSVMLPIVQLLTDHIGKLQISVSALVGILVVEKLTTEDTYERIKAKLTTINDQDQAKVSEELRKKVLGDESQP